MTENIKRAIYSLQLIQSHT